MVGFKDRRVFFSQWIPSAKCKARCLNTGFSGELEGEAERKKEKGHKNILQTMSYKDERDMDRW